MRLHLLKVEPSPDLLILPLHLLLPPPLPPAPQLLHEALHRNERLQRLHGGDQLFKFLLLAGGFEPESFLHGAEVGV